MSYQPPKPPTRLLSKKELALIGSNRARLVKTLVPAIKAAPPSKPITSGKPPPKPAPRAESKNYSTDISDIKEELKRLRRRIEAGIIGGGGGSGGGGALRSDADHGQRGGGDLHTDATLTDSGFLTALGNRQLRSLGIYPLEDGGTQDDINTAISVAQAAGYRRLHLRDGSWDIDCGSLSDSSALIIIPTGFTISGNGEGRTTLNISNTTRGAGQDGCDVFRTDLDATRIRVYGLHFLGDNGPDSDVDFSYVVNNQNCAVGIDNFGTVQDVHIYENTFQGLWGFSAHDPQGNTNERIHFYRNTLIRCANGVNLNSQRSQQCWNLLYKSEGFETSASQVQVSFNIGLNLLGTGCTLGGNQSPGASFPDNECSHNLFNTVESGVGIEITDCAHATRVQNNTVRKADHGALLVDAPLTPPNGLDISGNTFESNCKNPGVNVIGMDIRCGADHKIFNNTCLDLGIAGYQQAYGLKIATSTGCLVDANRLYGSSYDMSIGNGATNTRVGSNNDFVGDNVEWTGTSAEKINTKIFKTLTDPSWKRFRSGESHGDDYAAILELNNGTRRYAAGSGGVSYDVQTERSGVGIYKVTGKCVATAGLGVGNSASGSTPGTVVKKIQVFDVSGSSLGYIAVYDAIT